MKKSWCWFLFDEAEAFAKATEEQGRKSLHGRFLVWMKGWNALLHAAMSQSGKAANIKRDTQLHRDYVDQCASSHTFQDCETLLSVKVFKHKGCREGRRQDLSHFTVNPVSAKFFEEMQNYKGCHAHKGHIAN